MTRERGLYTATLLHSWLLDGVIYLVPCPSNYFGQCAAPCLRVAAAILDRVVSLTDYLRGKCHSQMFFSWSLLFSQCRNGVTSLLTSTVQNTGAHALTHTQSFPINVFRRAFHTKLIKRNRCHYQRRQRVTALTALQTALRPRRREMNDRMPFVDDPRNLIYSTTAPPPICVLQHRLILRSRHFRKGAHKLHYCYPSCTHKRVLAG